MKSHFYALAFLVALVGTANAQTTQSLTDYTANPLRPLIKVESQAAKLIVHGYRGQNYEFVNVTMLPGEVLSVRTTQIIFRDGYATPLPISIVTVPIKIRKKLDDTPRVASAGLANLGINLDLVRVSWDRYFTSGNKSTHRLGFGLWAAPSVEELDASTTDGYLTEKSKQLFVSTALTFTYTYNNFTFTVVPVGFDFATSSVGKEWIYDGESWWGFGIGVDTKIFTTLANK